MKAKSRLQTLPPPSEISVEKKIETPKSEPHVSAFRSKHTNHQKSEVLKKYLTHLKTFILCLPFYGLCFYMLRNLHPNQVKNVLIPNLYFPFQLSLFLGNVFFFSFLFLNTRRGLLITLFIQTFVFLKLQSVIMTWQLSLGIGVLFVIIEVVFSLINRAKLKAKR
jgi:hypothetical protein